MRILAVSNRVPAAERKGDQVVSFYRLVHLARKGHSIELVCFGNIKREEDQVAKYRLEELGIAVHFIQWNPIEAIFNVFMAIFDRKLPFQCALFKSKKFTEKVDNICSRMVPDAVYCVMIRVAKNAESFRGRMFVEIVDSMNLNFSRRVSLSGGIKRLLLSEERYRAAHFEKMLANRASWSFVVSKIDRDAIGESKIDVIPLGIDMRRFEKNRIFPSQPVVAFTGNMNYQPNVDAVIWFVRFCWPRVKDRFPGAKLVVAGSSPQQSVVLLGKRDSSISVTGRVSSMAEVLNASTVAIAPMQSGSGMQFKILEAMACGVPVVATSLGLGDIAAVPENDLFVGDSAEEFSCKVVSLINSQELNQVIGNNGFDYVVAHHSWDSLNDKFLARIESIA